MYIYIYMYRYIFIYICILFCCCKFADWKPLLLLYFQRPNRYNVEQENGFIWRLDDSWCLWNALDVLHQKYFSANSE